jgi:hypothetical protein
MFLHCLDERTLKDFGVTREEMNSFLDTQFTLAQRSKNTACYVASADRRHGDRNHETLFD